MQEESPEGGRFKKEVFVDNQSYLLLIRDEGGPPQMQVSNCKFYKTCIIPYKYNLKPTNHPYPWPQDNEYISNRNC